MYVLTYADLKKKIRWSSQRSRDDAYSCNFGETGSRVFWYSKYSRVLPLICVYCHAHLHWFWVRSMWILTAWGLYYIILYYIIIMIGTNYNYFSFRDTRSKKFEEHVLKIAVHSKCIITVALKNYVFISKKNHNNLDV